MHRCLQLAKLGAGNVAPNPMVGAVLVYKGTIIGEGFHQQYGQPHAEVNCIGSVEPKDHHLISQATLYVSLEPCAHFGKTPPCADLIIKKGIPKVVIGTKDPFGPVNGRGIEKLLAAGIEVVQNIHEDECIALNKRFFVYQQQRRPYIILKWAQTADKKISSGTDQRLIISNQFTNRLVHKWRSEESAILAGTNTVLMDDPSLNVRLWKGNNPVRMIIDMDLRLPVSLKVFDGKQQTIIFNAIKQEEGKGLLYYKILEEENLVSQVLKACYELNIQSLFVEGGAKLLQAFIDNGNWDEARVITNTGLCAGSGLEAPVLKNATALIKENILTDSITYFANNGNRT